MSGVSAATSAPPVTSPPIGTSSPDATSLLPDGEPLSETVLSDAMSALYVALSKSGQAQERQGEQRVQENQAVQQKAIADAKAAIQRQQDDQKKGGFWHDLESVAMVVAKVAAAVVAVAATVVTAGAASPVLIALALVFTAGGMAVSETKCFGDKASQWIGLGMEVVGTVISCGAATGATGATAATQVLKVTSGAASVAAAGATATAGVAHVESGAINADSLDASADLEAYSQHLQRLTEMVGAIIEDTNADDKSNQRAKGSLRSAIATNDETVAGAAPVAVKG